MKYRAEITTETQIAQALSVGAFEYIYAPMEFCGSGIADKSRIIAVPPVFLGGREREVFETLQKLREKGFVHALAHTLGHIPLIKNAGMSVHGGFRLNITNSLALKKYSELGLCDGFFSVELSFRNIEKITANIPMGIIAYGKLPLMLTRRCPVNDSAHCKNSGCNALTDRLGNKLQTLCRYGETEILNPIPIALSDRMSEFPADFADFAVLRFAPGENIAEIVSLYRQGAAFKGHLTRGLYYNRVK